MATDVRTGKSSRDKGEVEIALVDGMPVVSSLKVAEHFRKRHDDVLKAIRNISGGLPEDFCARNFAETSVEVAQPNGGVRTLPAFDLTRDAFALVIMGFTGSKALAWKIRYIEAFNAMEKKILHQLKSNTQQELDADNEDNKQYFQFKQWESINGEKLKGIIGWLNYWCKIDNLEFDEAVKQLCTVLQVNNLQEIQEEDTVYAYNFIWCSLFKIRNKSGVELTKEQQAAFNGILLFWEKCIGESSENIVSFICTKCNIKSFSEIKQHSLDKALNAALLGIFRHVFCNLSDKVYKI